MLPAETLCNFGVDHPTGPRDPTPRDAVREDAGMAKTRRTYDHRELVRQTGEVMIAVELGAPRSTAAAWLRRIDASVARVNDTPFSAEQLSYGVSQVVLAK